MAIFTRIWSGITSPKEKTPVSIRKNFDLGAALSILIRAYKREGIKGIILIMWLVLSQSHLLISHNTNKQQNKRFLFNGSEYEYHCSLIGLTWSNERAVEIPIIMKVVNEYQGRKILEVGNVLSYYFRFEHDIVDKYEVRKGIINQDVVNFKPNLKYDLIVSISTLEHVGWDENPRDDSKVLKAVENLKTLISPRGKIIVTLPVGYNIVMDKLLKNGIIPFREEYYLKRGPRSLEWRQAKSWKDVEDTKYDQPFRGANALIIGVIGG
jgi:hypothetical protein